MTIALAFITNRAFLLRLSEVSWDKQELHFISRGKGSANDVIAAALECSCSAFGPRGSVSGKHFHEGDEMRGTHPALFVCVRPEKVANHQLGPTQLPPRRWLRSFWISTLSTVPTFAGVILRQLLWSRWDGWPSLWIAGGLDYSFKRSAMFVWFIASKLGLFLFRFLNPIVPLNSGRKCQECGTAVESSWI